MIALRDTHRRRKSIPLTGRRSPRRFHWPVFALILAFALLAAACGRVVAPQGWAGPSVSEDGKTLYASIERGKMAALDANMLAETGAQCDNTADDDGDGTVNEGCPLAGQKSEEHEQCLNDTNDDQNSGVPDDSLVNDGCPATIVRWIFPPDTDEGNKLKLEGIYGAPVHVGNAIYFGAYDGNVYALDATAGTPLWRFGTADPIVSALAVKDDTLYATSTDGALYAIAAATGGEKGRFETSSSIWSSPLLVGDVVYVAAMDGELYAVDANTLAPISGFSFKTEAGLLMDPKLADKDTLLAGGIDNKLFALDPKTGKQLWSKPFEGSNWFWATPLVLDDSVIIPDLDGKVHAVNLKDGTPRWSKPFEANAPVRSAPLLAGSTLLIVDQKGNTYGLSPADGSLQWGPTLLGKTVLSDPFLLQSPSGAANPAASAASPGSTAGAVQTGEVLIVAQGGDLCRVNPVDGTPTAPPICAEVPQ